ncbi:MULTISPECIES: hypothetical protein [unclassified Streptomyces]|uniref:hypothetical protein n=1 Tax=unclassified Streptomyces TaxID=2593676 RepID=UPI001F46DB90|nr:MULTISPECIES: hypothetical protein [unclassified Streptomyces]
MDTQQNTALTRALAEIPGPLPTRGVVHITLPHTDRFTVVGNHLAQHPELSLAAIGLAVRIQSLPRGTDISVKTLAAQCREGERLIASRLRELEACGYLQRARERRPDGRITTRTLYCNHPAALTAHHAQARPGTLPHHRSIPHQRSAPPDRPFPHHPSVPAPHHRPVPAPLDRSIPAADPEHQAVAAPSPVPAPAPAPAERSAPAQEAARQAVPEADRPEAPEPAAVPTQGPAPEPAAVPAQGPAPEPAAVPAQGPAPTPVPAENPAPESEQTPAPAQPPTPAPSRPSPMPRSAPLVPHPTARKLPAPPLPRPGTPTPQLTHAATALLSDLRRHAPELTLSAADIGTLAPAVVA